MSYISRLPILKNIWSYLREEKIMKKHQEVSSFWQPIIESYFNNDMNSYQLIKGKNVDNQKIIWQYWGQGIDEDLPEVVKVCFDSIDKYREDWVVIRLDDSSISEYLEFPEFVYQKLNAGIFTKTFFSDLLRVALLDLYGGLWLDATVLMTAPISERFSDVEYFVFQRDENEKYKSFWKNSYAYYWNWNSRFKVNVLSSVFFSRKNGEVVHALLDLMLYYWETQSELKDYFVFQILIDDVMNGYLKDKRCDVVSDVIPHVLQTKFNGLYPYLSVENVLEQTNLHKMSYFDESGLKNFKAFLNGNLS